MSCSIINYGKSRWLPCISHDGLYCELDYIMPHEDFRNWWVAIMETIRVSETICITLGGGFADYDAIRVIQEDLHYGRIANIDWAISMDSMWQFADLNFFGSQKITRISWRGHLHKCNNIHMSKKTE